MTDYFNDNLRETIAKYAGRWILEEIDLYNPTPISRSNQTMAVLETSTLHCDNYTFVVTNQGLKGKSYQETYRPTRSKYH